MSKTLLTLMGLLLIAILSFYCFKDKEQHIREDLTASTQAVLTENNINNVTATLLGDDIEMQNIMRLEGEVATQEIKSKAADVAAGIVGISAVQNALTLPQDKASKTTQKEEKQEIKEGKIKATKDDNKTSSQKAQNTPSAEKAEKQQVSLPASSEKKSTENINTKDYALLIQKEKNGALVLDGFVEDASTKKMLIENAQKHFNKAQVIDHLKIKKGAPDEWKYISGFAIDMLNDVDYGDMKLKGNSYAFTAHLPSPSSKEKFLNHIKTVMSDPENHYGGFKGDYIITAPVEEPKKSNLCQTKLDTLLKENKILFDFNQDSIQEKSFSLLEKILLTLKSCHATRFDIIGYTDNQGDASYNKDLSQRRAKSVRTYFIKKGFSSKSIQALGRGIENPIASNDTKENRAKNRRIEFNIKGVK